MLSAPSVLIMILLLETMLAIGFGSTLGVSLNCFAYGEDLVGLMWLWAAYRIGNGVFFGELEDGEC